jgi:hypothetical protein
MDRSTNPSLTLEQLSFDNSYLRLPPEFYHVVSPQPLRDSHLISFNAAAAALIDLDPEQAKRDDFVAYFSGAKPLPGAEPLAMCYSGHQFGVNVPRLGDGRAVLLGQVRKANDELWDLQLKGSGPTRYSRGADGRAVLRSSIREYLCSEAMHNLGIPTTRALCLIGSSEAVYRERAEPGAMIVRMAQSHVRFGTFEYFYYTGQHDYLKLLADYVIDEYFPALSQRSDRYLALLEEVTVRTARLIAQWQRVGFAHGVMNSDNMSILGLTLDYGPFGFLDAYQAGFICNHSDSEGRYAFDQQPHVGLFNISCLAQALLPLLADNSEQAIEIAKAQLNRYWPLYRREELQMVRNKLGLQQARDEDLKLWKELLALMEGQTDYTLFFRALCDFNRNSPEQNHTLRDMFLNREAFDEWANRYAQRLAQEQSEDAARRERMRRVNPKYVLRNYMAEMAIRKAEDQGDFSEIERLMTLLRNPYDEQPGSEHYAELPPEWAEQISVSCSS